jgi:hypothetical protein
LPKKTTQAIIDSNNDYIITVKKNQPSLHKLLEEKSSCFLAIDRDIQEEKSKGSLPSERKSRAEGCIVILSRIGITYYFLLITYLASF